MLTLGPAAARRRRPKPSPRWRLDGMAARIAGEQMHLWRAVDDVGEMLDVLVQRRRNRTATHKLLEKRGLGFRCNDLPRVAESRGRQRVSAPPKSTSSTIISSRSVRSAKSCSRSPPVPPADVPGLRTLLAVVVAVATLHFGGEVLVPIGADRNPLGPAFQRHLRWRAIPRGRAPLRC